MIGCSHQRIGKYVALTTLTSVLIYLYLVLSIRVKGSPKQSRRTEGDYTHRNLEIRVVIDNATNKLERLLRVGRVGEDGTKAPPTSSPPHIVFILADDLGWADVGYHDSEIKTPTIDKLAFEGVRLENYYAQSKCTPSRASLLTGRYGSRTGLEHVLHLSEAACLPKQYPTMSQALRNIGYKTHLLGKWHLGMSRNECLPNQKGFDTFLGFLCGAERYFKHTQSMPMVTIPDRYFETYDFWENNNVTYKHQGEYSTHVYTQRAQSIIKEHGETGEPMFLFLSFQAVHGPLEVPESYMTQYGNINDTTRRTYAGVTTCMDEGIHNITASLKEHGLWNNTVLIFSSDNGGTSAVGGKNTPLLGEKSQFYEGGIRVVALVNSPLIGERQRGTVYDGLMGIADWFPTLVNGIGRSPLKTEGLDGVNMWDSLRFGTKSPRKEYLHIVGGNCDWDPDGPYDQRQIFGTLRLGDWKIIIGNIGQKIYYPIPKDPEAKDIILHMSTKRKYLFNLKDDPYERENLYKERPGMVTILFTRLREHCRNHERYTPVVERESADPALNGGVLVPWLKDGDELEWHGTEEDRERFLKFNIEV